MLVGHYAPALALRRLAPTVPLWGLLLAVQAVDVGFFALVFAGVESGSLDADRLPRLLVEHGVWTHSLLMSAAYAAGCVVVGALMSRAREGAVIGAAVLSHWFADLVVHAPDLPLTLEQGSAVGLGLWTIPVAAWLLEVGLVLAAGHWLAAAGGNRSRLRALVLGLVVLQTLSEFVIPLPPDDVALGITALPLYFAIAAAGWWVERAPPGSAAGGVG